jgi:hypothetical protein
MKRYTEEVNDVIIALESRRLWVFQGLYWLAAIILAVFDGSVPGSNPPVNLVLRDRATGAILYCNGPLQEEEAVHSAKEAARVIAALGVQGYVRRERA